MKKIVKIILIALATLLFLIVLFFGISVYMVGKALEPTGNWVVENDRRVLKDWVFFLFPEGIDTSIVSGRSKDTYPSIEECQKDASEKYPNKDYFCGTECISVWDGMRIEHCKKGVATICSNNKCKFVDHPNIGGRQYE